VAFFPIRSAAISAILKKAALVRAFAFGTSIAFSARQIRGKNSAVRRPRSPASAGNGVRPMKTNVKNLLIGAFVGVATLGLLGCADTENTSAPYVPPASETSSSTTTYSTTTPATQVVDVPTTVTTYPSSANTTTTTTHYGDGTVQKSTTTDYAPSYNAYGPPYATTVVQNPPPYTTTVVQNPPVVSAPAVTTTRTTSTTTNDDGSISKETTTTVSPNY
jgi:hypothetical protein